jgi:predicted MFS family arabinose efflux permease
MHSAQEFPVYLLPALQISLTEKNYYSSFILALLRAHCFAVLPHHIPCLLLRESSPEYLGGVIGSISMAIVADLFPLEQRGRVMGFLQMGLGASQVLGIPIGLYIANIWGWQSPFFMIAGLASLTWLAVVFKMKPITQHLNVQSDKTALTHLLHTISKRNYRIGFFATAMLSLGGFMMMPWGSAFAINNLGVTAEELPLLFMVAGVSSLIIMPLIGRISDQVDKFKIFAIASFWMMIMVIIYTNLSVIPFGFVIMINIFFMMGIMSRMVPAIAMITALPQLQDRGAFMSINSSLQQIAGGIAAAAGGMIVTQKDKFSPLEHYNTLGYVIVGLSIICVFMVYRVSNMIKKEKEKTDEDKISVTLTNTAQVTASE